MSVCIVESAACGVSGYDLCNAHHISITTAPTFSSDFILPAMPRARKTSRIAPNAHAQTTAAGPPVKSGVSNVTETDEATDMIENANAIVEKLFSWCRRVNRYIQEQKDQNCGRKPTC
jgi:hypothetical protein